jgi:hypothetical protein
MATVSIQLVSPASGDTVTLRCSMLVVQRFHSISFPSEWGPKHIAFLGASPPAVSIQLVSPASGDHDGNQAINRTGIKVSIQLVSPASGDWIRCWV